ncbi:hypothetical protein SRS16CHR_02762 [Variovorax sp. SRS16]|uniref:FAS1-like dehydratase domain-containing protein n=1 Tax=Variovorax sp. SRS16 TaxID=282217 RepID=UPI001316AE66|nr:MaoC family dehydratase N-terminal domain-containing protein [Variovorax sp. SRS16]VTU21033.1 hypothetical protein SRS16CHR_02762 [Variovorax sp. SRS16]
MPSSRAESAPSTDAWKDWVGRTEQRTDMASAASAAALAATLDREDPGLLPGSALPPLRHWLYFTPRARQSEIGDDGHEKRGGFLPPVPLPRRMWAGGSLQFDHPLRVDDEITRASRIVSIDARKGRSGELVFVKVLHRIANAEGTAVTEEHDIVYRSAPVPGAPEPAPLAAPADEAFSREIRPDPVMLFRYSALTFNGHRIHYDRDYVTRVEGYPGLVVHGPLIATLLLDLVDRERPDARVHRFKFKAVRPLFDIHPFTVCGRPDGEGRLALWARDHQGYLAMQAEAELL